MDTPQPETLANGDESAVAGSPAAVLPTEDSPATQAATPPQRLHPIQFGWGKALRRIPQDIIDLILPPSCLCCHQPLDHSQSFLCTDCLPTLALTDHACLRCGAPLPVVVPETYGCLRCQGRTWAFQRAVAVGPYCGSLQKLVIAMKKIRHEATTLYFGRLLAARLYTTGIAAEIDLIVPVPSHWWRRLIRKVSTAEVLAEVVARELHVPWNRQLVRRTRYTPKQGMLRASERKTNVQGAFRARMPSHWRGSRILLVDDVLTSGSTASEVSRALILAGAKEVTVGAIARALGDQRAIFVEEQEERIANLAHPVANLARDSDHGKES